MAPAASRSSRNFAAIVARCLLRKPRYLALIVPRWNRLNHAAHSFDCLMARSAAGCPPRLSGCQIAENYRKVFVPRMNARDRWIFEDVPHVCTVDQES